MWREHRDGADHWLCRDERNVVVGKSGRGDAVTYDRAAVEAVLQRRWGKSVASLEAEVQAAAQQRQADETRRAQAKQLLRDFAARDASTITQREAVTALQALIRSIIS